MRPVKDDTEVLENERPLPSSVVVALDLPFGPRAACLAEVQLDPSCLDEATRARMEACHRHHRELQQRFVRWFPRLQERPAEPLASDDDQRVIERVCRVLAVVSETLSAAPARPLDLQADAIELVERLLLDEHLTPWRYSEALRRWPGRLCFSMHRVHEAAGLDKAA